LNFSDMKPIKSIKAVLFDFDGTLTCPGALDWTAIKQEVGCPLDRPVLEFIQSLPENKQQWALEKLEQFESAGAVRSEPNHGAEKMVSELRSRGLPLAVISRNSLRCIHLALNNFKGIRISDFEFIISRDDPVSPKPSPEGVLLAARKLGLSPEELLVVGDYVIDIQAGRTAGAPTVFLDSGQTSLPSGLVSDYTINSLPELSGILDWRLPLPMGKVPNPLLETIINECDLADPSLLVPPGIGEDTAAVDLSGADTLVLKTDPITFTTESMAKYAVLINANDIATSGARPKWFLATLLFPPDSCAAEIRECILELNSLCHNRGMVLCGGHTEITDAVTRPVIFGSLAGVIDRNRLIKKQNMVRGDCVLLTKGLAVEGTSIIAREFGDRLRQAGLTEEEIETSARYLDQLSILEEAEIAARSEATTAMHDVTEGGLATALEELSLAGRHQIRVDLDQIPVLPQTEKICGLLDLHPLGLIGSGSLIICCQRDACGDLIERIRQSGIEVARIGEVLDSGTGIKAYNHNRPASWSHFKVDELAKLYVG
jgi:HAD superfamily hydrolase (TIGR01509 family)